MVATDSILELRKLIDRGERQAAQSLLYREHSRAVRRFVAARVLPSAVDDVCQEVWAAVIPQLDRYSLQVPPRVWLFAIARNKSHDAWRAQKLVETLDSQLEDGGPLAEIVGVRAPERPSREISRRRRSERVRRALTALRKDDCELLELRFVQGLKPGEIATLLGETANTISQRIVRAARRLRESLERDG